MARTTAAARSSPPVGDDGKPLGGSLDLENAPARSQRHPDAVALPQQRVEDVARAIGVGKQLAVLFLVQADADLAEEGDGVRDRNARSTRRMIDARPPQKSRSVTIALVTLQREPPLTRIFAPGFRAPSSSTTERAGFETPGENRRREAGGAGADDRHVCTTRKIRSRAGRSTAGGSTR